uniref:Uncharacterized protein n=1 Tax=Siphoviridae sp. ctyjS2 TaxID=2827284 RepID=A0A8S5R4H3_9CAUD|nr:MAG TPA: hypothetical protein [Siphoviridae sp. ctyjS2]
MMNLKMYLAKRISNCSSSNKLSYCYCINV